MWYVREQSTDVPENPCHGHHADQTISMGLLGEGV